jgi:hypothetical protein
MNIKKWWNQSLESKALAQVAIELAESKQLHKAIQQAKKAKSLWSEHPNLLERNFCQMTMGKLLHELTEHIATWQQQTAYADQLMLRAKSYEGKLEDPTNYTDLTIALSLYEQAISITKIKEYHDAIQRCKQELSQRQQYEHLLHQARQQEANYFFREAKESYTQAILLYGRPEVDAALANCSAHLQAETVYEQVLREANQLAQRGEFSEAIALAKPATEKFVRADGKEFLSRLNRIVRSKEQFKSGLAIEQSGDFEQAHTIYASALESLPELTECRTRLSVVAIKTNRHHEVSNVLKNLPDEQSAYLRGLAYAKQGDLQKADREWLPIEANPSVASQRKTLKTLAQWEKLLLLRQIEQQVDALALNAAKTSSLQFVQKFGGDDTVEENLRGHIQARMESELWKTQDWDAIAQSAQENWLTQQDITSLHNWAIACYYRVKSRSEQPGYIQSLQDFIPVWLTALANFKDDPALHQLAWTNPASVDCTKTISQLRQKLESLIDELKEKDVKTYLQLRDHYRLGSTVSRLLGDRSKELVILPKCLAGERVKSKNSNISKNLLERSLYTDWGLAVAACIEGDVERAIQLKPYQNDTTPEKKYAHQFVAYHEGCYHLKDYDWRKAMFALKKAQTEITATPEWKEYLNQLCNEQRQKIHSQDDHLQFAEIWYELLKSPAARSYLAETKTEALREKLASDKISENKAKGELKEILKLDPQNPVTLDLYEKVQASIDIPEICRLLKAGNTQAAMRLARQSDSQLTRTKIAELFITIILDGLKHGRIERSEVYQFGQWAYELAPDEPSFLEIFQSLGLR